MKIKVLSRVEFEEYIGTEPYIVISITDPNSEPVKVNKTNLFDIFSLQFHDIDRPLVNRRDCKKCNGTGIREEFININNGHCYACTTAIDIILFNEEDAKGILHFVETYKKEVDLIVVHCEAGISRSAGVASALSLIYNGTDEYYFKHHLPNILVYRLILNAYMKDKTWVIETKLNFGFKVLSQADKWVGFANYVSIGVPYKYTNLFRERIASLLGIGVLAVNKHRYKEEFIITERTKLKEFLEPFHILKDRLNEKQKSFAKAGNSDGNRYTPYKYTVKQLEELTQKEPGIKLKEAVTKIKHHYRTDKNAINSIAQWIHKGQIKGMNCLYYND